jgi:hypothetical protein
MPAGFEDFVEAVGSPAEETDLPPTAPVDLSGLPEIAARHGIDILGPPPEE